MKNFKLFALIFFVSLISLALDNPKAKGIVKLRMLQDTVVLSKSDFNSTGAKFEYTIKNTSNKSFNIPEDGFTQGYKDESFFDFYLEFYKLDNGRLVPYKHEWKHAMAAEYLGDYVNLKPNKSIKFSAFTDFYAFPNAGKYYYKIVFMNKYKYLGASNLDSVIVIEK